MEQKHLNQVKKLANFIWRIADESLRDRFSKLQYRNVLLPMTVLRRFDILLESTKEEVLKTKKLLDEAGGLSEADMSGALCVKSGYAFYNTSPFTLKDLTSRTNSAQLMDDFTTYLDGYSPNVKKILENFDFINLAHQIDKRDKLGSIIEGFCRSNIYLSPLDSVNENGEIIYGMDNHMMGTLYEEILRKFNDESNAAAGAYFTPRDIVQLMADLVFVPVADKIENSTYSLYDGACGSGGMLTVGEERLKDIADKKGKKLTVFLFGQETDPETFAVCQADLLIKGNGEDVERIKLGSTLSEDKYSGSGFDFMLSNPPYGTDWSDDLKKMTNNSSDKKDIRDERFSSVFNGETLSMLPRKDDGQLMFLANNVSKMKSSTKLGSRIAEIHNGSSLFTGDAGQGESNFRRYLFENDLVEGIVALPLNMFYNTGLATYIWVLSNKKSDERRGKVQLIDATSLKTDLLKNLGDKNCELSEMQRKEILDIFLDFKESENSKIFRNEDFGFCKVTVDRPLRDADGKIITDKKGKMKMDKNLKDSESVPLTYEGGIRAFMEKEVLPYVPDAIWDEKKAVIGYEVSFTKVFYKPVRLRTLDEITADIKGLEGESEGLLREIL